MNILEFKADEVRRIVEHVKAAKEFQQNYDGKEQKGTVCLVHDDGVYLMSGAKERDKIMKPSRKGAEPTETSFCAHAKGTNPLVDEDWWENARFLVGGDDFVEYLPVSGFEKALAGNPKVVKVGISPTKIEVYMSGPAPLPAKPKRGRRKAA